MKKTIADFKEITDLIFGFINTNISKLSQKLPEDSIAEVKMLKTCKVEKLQDFFNRKESPFTRNDIHFPGIFIGETDEEYQINIIIDVSFSRTNRHSKVVLEGYYFGRFTVTAEHGGSELHLSVPGNELTPFTQFVDLDEDIVVIEKQ